jgi:HAD superfamily hydrolase (TIGR01509 family)
MPTSHSSRSTRSAVQLLIFDCDGVLVDSEPIANRVFADMLQELGLSISVAEMYEQFVGYSMSHCMQLIEHKLGRAAPEDFEQRLQERTFAAFEAAPLKPTPGIIEALDAITVPVCVASSGELAKMQLTLGLTGLLPRFAGRLFSVTQVAHGKPAPDIYLQAAKTLGAMPHACVVVEDSPVGAAAGIAAGMTVLGYSAHTDPQKLERVGVYRTFAEMRELPALIERIATS